MKKKMSNEACTNMTDEDITKLSQSYPKIPTFKQSGFEQPICRYVLPLITAYDDAWHVMATSVMIAPGLALTAKHVIEECLKIYRGDREKMQLIDVELEVDFTVSAIQFLSAENAVKWWVKKINFSKHTDIAFLEMQPLFEQSKILRKKVSINFFPPKIHSRIVAFGYPKGTVFPKSEKIEVRLDPRTAVGEVIEVHHTRRDPFALPFPCFQTNARFDNGMSGGGVFDESGKLCGLVCRNMPPEADGQEHVSYAVLLWPGMHTPLTLPRKHDPKAVPYPALELARDKYIDGLGWENIEIASKDRISWKTIGTS